MSSGANPSKRVLKNALFGVVQKPTTIEAPTPGTLVLQSLMYILWGLTVLATTILAAYILAVTIGDAEAAEHVTYAIAATMVILPFAIVTDTLYSKRETARKNGFALAIMVVFAVVIGLIALGTLLGTIFALITILVQSDTANKAPVVAFWSLLLATALYSILFLRTLTPTRFVAVRRYHSLGMLVVVGLIALIGIFGPWLDSHSRRNDRLIENNLHLIQGNIDSYIDAKEALPTSLSELKPSETEAKTLINNNMLSYTPHTKPAEPSQEYEGEYTLYYQLCVTYTDASNETEEDDYYNQVDGDGYAEYLYTTPHDKGRVCYKLKGYVY